MIRPLFLIFCTSALTACKLGPQWAAPPTMGGSSWKQSQHTSAQPLPDAWWQLFRDPELNKLIEKALQANQDLAVAKSRVDTSRALVGVDRARLFPRLEGTISAGVRRGSEQAVTGNLPPGAMVDLTNQQYQSSLDLSYELDLWGRNQRRLESSSAQAAASDALLDWQRLGVATEVARQYFLLSGLDAQLAVIKQTLQSREDALAIEQSRNNAGLADGLSSSRSRTELELAKNDLAAIERQRGGAEHALAVLCGQPPASFSLKGKSRNSILPKVSPALPAKVLERRPDVRAALQNLRAANAQIGVAEAAFYPNFNLLASGGIESLQATDFLNWQNRILALSSAAVMPIVDGGSNRANYQAAIARYREAFASYQQSMLVALREVEDALLDHKSLAKSRSALSQALSSAQETKAIALERYQKGLSNYLEVVDADRTVLQTELALAQLDAQQRITFSLLAKALGGGWQSSK